MTKTAALTEYSASILDVDMRIEKCLSDIETILKEDLASEHPKSKFLQWRLQYDAALVEIESADMRSALRSALEEIHERGASGAESIEGLVLPLVDYVKSVISIPPLESYPASCPFCPNYKAPDAAEQESLQFLSAIGQHVEANLLRTCLTPKCDVSLDEQFSYFDYRQKLALLKSLYDAEHINDLHWKVREKQLASFDCSCCGDQCLFCFLETCAKYLALDMALVDSGFFQPLQVSDKQLHTLYNKCVLDFIEILLDDKLEEDHLVSNRNTFRCCLRERLLGVESVPQLADEGITQILQDMNWFDARLKYYLAKYAYGDTHISVDTSWVAQSVRNLVSTLETLIPGVRSACQPWSSILAEEERFKTVPCSMDGSERTVQIFGPAWDFLLHLQRFSAIVGKSNSKSLIVSLNHFLHTGIDVVTATCTSISKRSDIDERTYVAYNSVAYVRSQLETFQLEKGDVAEFPTGVMQKLYTVEDSLEYDLVCHHIKWASSPARHTLYDFSSVQKPDMDEFTLAPAALHIYMETLCQQLSEVLCQVGCQRVVARIWSELSTMLCATYVQARASEQQVGLLSRDIEVVLGTSFNVLLFICDRVDEVLGALDDNGDLRKIRHIKNIHASCVLLLSTKYLNGSPLGVLCQTFKGGFVPEGKLLPGLFWVSHLFQSSLSEASFKVDSAPNILVWIMLEMMRVQKNFNFVLCVKAMRSFNHMLSILLVRQGCTGGHLSESEQAKLMDCALSLATARPACEVSHSFVGDMLIPIVEKTNSWQALSSDSLNANRPWWYKVLQRVFEKSFGKSVLLSITDLIMARSKAFDANDRWKATRERLRGFVGEQIDENTDYVLEADRILQHMIDHLGLVSRDILACFAAMNDCKADTVNPVLDSIGLQFLINTVCDFLKDPEFLRKVYGITDAVIEENCRRLCEALQGAVFGEGRGQEMAERIRRKLKVIKHIIGRNRDLLPPTSIADPNMDFLKLPLSAFDHQIWSQLASQQDSERLTTARNVLKYNQLWFRKNLGVEQFVTFAQPGLTGDHEVVLKISCPDENRQAKNLIVDPLRSYSLWKAGCADRFESLKGLNPQISSVANVLSEFNVCTILRHHPGLCSKEEKEETNEAEILRSVFQLSKIPDDEHWQKLTYF